MGLYGAGVAKVAALRAQRRGSEDRIVENSTSRWHDRSRAARRSRPGQLRHVSVLARRFLSFDAQVCNTYNLATSQPQAVVMQRHTFLLAILTHDIKVSVCRTEDRQPA